MRKKTSRGPDVPSGEDKYGSVASENPLLPPASSTPTGGGLPSAEVQAVETAGPTAGLHI